jgi:hypothetical protein
MSGMIALALLTSTTLLMALLGIGPFAKHPFQRYHMKLRLLKNSAQLLLKRTCQLVLLLSLLYFLGLIR